MSREVAYPQLIVPVGHVEPVPRRVRAVRDGKVVLDTMRALYVWEFPPYPQYYFPLDEVDPALIEALGDAAEVHDEKVDVVLDGEPLARPRTPFS